MTQPDTPQSSSVEIKFPLAMDAGSGNVIDGSGKLICTIPIDHGHPVMISSVGMHPTMLHSAQMRMNNATRSKFVERMTLGFRVLSALQATQNYANPQVEVPQIEARLKGALILLFQVSIKNALEEGNREFLNSPTSLTLFGGGSGVYPLDPDEYLHLYNEALKCFDSNLLQE